MLEDSGAVDDWVRGDTGLRKRREDPLLMPLGTWSVGREPLAVRGAASECRRRPDRSTATHRCIDSWDSAWRWWTRPEGAITSKVNRRSELAVDAIEAPVAPPTPAPIGADCVVMSVRESPEAATKKENKINTRFSFVSYP